MSNPPNLERKKLNSPKKFSQKTYSDARLFRNPKLGLFKSANWPELSGFLKLARVKFKKLSVFDVNKVISHA